MSEYIYVVEVEYDQFGGSFSQKRREEIVRCRDCKYSSYDNLWCYRLPITYEPPITPDGFCAWGGEEMSALDDIAWYNTLLQTGGKTYDRVVFDELVESERADSEEGNASGGVRCRAQATRENYISKESGR